ncbi:DUF4279 domain-containing protein [Pseudomonas kilonensis]|uniref:DUF4279 domain-containing protein n=1 Tax=Pseudomonas kilonensis TaxID=132476 RepID=UPI00046681C8|nr:DUF4279 domain-containing protein [Pseudomonas kilonensis]
MTSACEVYLGLYGDDFEPDDVSDFIGLMATSIQLKGEHDSDLAHPKASVWKFSLGRIESEVVDVYEMSEKLVEQLSAFEFEITGATQKFNLSAKLQVVLWIDQNDTKSMPSIGFERPVLRFLNAISASIDIDTYRGV